MRHVFRGRKVSCCSSPCVRARNGLLFPELAMRRVFLFAASASREFLRVTPTADVTLLPHDIYPNSSAGLVNTDAGLLFNLLCCTTVVRVPSSKERWRVRTKSEKPAHFSRRRCCSLEGPKYPVGSFEGQSEVMIHTPKYEEAGQPGRLVQNADEAAQA